MSGFGIKAGSSTCREEGKREYLSGSGPLAFYLAVQKYSRTSPLEEIEGWKRVKPERQSAAFELCVA